MRVSALDLENALPGLSPFARDVVRACSDPESGVDELADLRESFALDSVVSQPQQTTAGKEAAKVGHEWRDTADMLKKAEETAAKGDYAAAQKLADKARRQSENAIAQAKEQEQAWQAAVIK